MSIRTTIILPITVVLLAWAGIMLWISLRSESVPAAGAQEVVENACDSMEKVESYDMAATIKGTADGEFDFTGTFKAEVSGQDFRYENQRSDGSSNMAIRVGGKDYVRYTRVGEDGIANTKAWELSAHEIRHAESWLTALGDSPICPDVSEVTFISEEQLAGVKVSRYVSGDFDGDLKDSYFNDKGFEGVVYFHAHEYWVDADGQLVQHRLEQNSVSQGYGAERRVTNLVAVTKFLNVGEPNTITAPVIGE